MESAMNAAACSLRSLILCLSRAKARRGRRRPSGRRWRGARCGCPQEQRTGTAWEHLAAEGSPEVADDVLAAALLLLGGVDAQHHLAGDRLRGALR
ncbi:unnamed protein product [Miscanthus lutarioriparius]|uniref:Uncharacterized protein n=1 Tax=Miscanthus lutarioriparius TaxID=422564 RepID=A0A811NGW2_9POAL|nr:unnamed protein product [Miscanthus lutarioriparius]